MAGPIDDAYVEIHPDAGHFAAETRAELDVAFASIERKLDDVVDTIDNAFDRLIVVLDSHFSELVHETRDGFDRMEDSARHTAEAIGFEISAGADVAKHAIDDLADNADHDFNRISRSARKAGESTGTSFFAGLLAKIPGFGGGGAPGGGEGGGILGSLGGLLGGGGDIFSAIKIGAIAAAVPIVISLGAALSQLLGLLGLIPGLAGTAVAGIIPLVIAFQGFGEAIGAGFSGDAKKFKESLKGLAEPAQTVVKEIVGLKGILNDIKKNVQTAFFAPMIGEFRILGNTLLPVVNAGFEIIADSLGRFVAGILNLLSQPRILDDINRTLQATARIIDRFAPVATKLFGALLDTMAASLPFVERLFDNLNGGLSKFADYLENAISSGDFQGFLEDAFRVSGELFDLLKSVGNLLASIFGNSDQQAAGEDFIVKLTEMTNRLADFFRTADGKKILKDLADVTEELAYALLGLGIIVANVLRWLHDFVVAIDATVAFIGRIPGYLSTAWNAIVSGVTTAWNAVKNFFVDGWNTVIGAISTFISNVGTYINQLPTMLENAAKNAFDRFFFAVGYGIGLILGEFNALPGQVWANVKLLWDGVSALFVAGIEFVVNYALSLPDKVVAAFILTKNKATAIIVSLWRTVLSFFSQLISDVSTIAHRLPGMIEDAWHSLIGKARNIGADMIDGMINGIKDRIDSLVSWAKRAVTDALNAAKKALSSFSPSKKWAQLGRDSMDGYKMGAELEAKDLTKTVTGIISMPLDMLGSRNAPAGAPTTPTVSVGGAQVVAYLQINDDQLHPVVVRAVEQNPQAVALANENGSTKLVRRR